MAYVIESYVSTASPVGSELIAQKLRSSLSSATIRNVMVELEQVGFLHQPHTSAGRVPTQRGYRFYVDSVMEARQLLPEQVHQLQQLIESEPVEEVDQLLSHAIGVLSELTQQAAFVVAPTVKHSTVRQIELVPIGARKILCVLVANDEIFASHVVEIQEPLGRDEALSLARFFNTELVGLPFSELLGSLERRLLAENDSFYYLVKRSFQILQQALATEPDERLFIEGTSYVMAQPEFRKDPEMARRLLQTLESHDAWLAYLREDLRSGAVRVHIGAETEIPGFESCSYISVPFAVGGSAIGGLGVLGPVRMDYGRMRSLVEGVAACLRDELSQMEAI